jgi:hypothetical protein
MHEASRHPPQFDDVEFFARVVPDRFPTSHGCKETDMRRHHLAFGLVAIAAVLAWPAQAADTLVQFNGGIGVQPVAGIANGAPVANTVLGVPPGGRPWVIRKLNASVQADGSVSIRGQGLLLAGGDAIGTRATIAQVFATLFCGTTALQSPVADLDTAGDFRIKGVLSAAPPNPCNAPVLLIRSTTGTQAWFAAGIPGGDD